MTFYMITQLNNRLDINDINIENNNSELLISKTLNIYLQNIKKQIDSFPQKWDSYKKYTNPYEYIHTTIPGFKVSISLHKPLSRSYFKLIEILRLHDIIDNYKNTNINSFHLAEGPGGFIEAMCFMRNNKDDNYYGMTLIDNEDLNIPGWNKSKDFLNKHSNVNIVKGADNTGDILKIDNLEYCYENYKNSMDIITADGGFDFSVDFNRQEDLATNLIFAQICFAIIMQKKGGSFIIKFFDIFNKATVDMIYLLNCLYDKIYITKPHTSRYANSERYVVCKGFKINDSDIYYNKFYELYKNNIFYKNITNILNIQYPILFINKLEEINAVIGQYQIENINSTINLINSRTSNEKLESIRKQNIQKCINWCSKYKIAHNKSLLLANNFITE